MPKNCTNCKHGGTDINEWPCNMCDDIGYGPSKWEVKDDDPKCSFCWSLKANEEEITGTKKFGVKLIINAFNDDGKYDETYSVENEFELNYCPVCGKEIRNEISNEG